MEPSLSNPAFITDDRFAVTCSSGEAWSELVNSSLSVVLGDATFKLDNWNSAKKLAYYIKVS